eukprot:scaffold64414_cov31-Tisochrysis_lutea.AAC.4
MAVGRGEATTTREHPATRAVTAVISTVEGSGTLRPRLALACGRPLLRGWARRSPARKRAASAQSGEFAAPYARGSSAAPARWTPRRPSAPSLSRGGEALLQSALQTSLRTSGGRARHRCG